MKLLTPPIKDCRYIHKKLRLAYKENEYIGNGTPDDKEFNRAIKRFCEFYKIWTPRIDWAIEIHSGKYLGLCSDTGVITLLTPATHQGGERGWINTVYHELGHFILWADAEAKAEAFAKRMMGKWRK